MHDGARRTTQHVQLTERLERIGDPEWRKIDHLLRIE